MYLLMTKYPNELTRKTQEKTTICRKKIVVLILLHCQLKEEEKEESRECAFG